MGSDVMPSGCGTVRVLDVVRDVVAQVAPEELPVVAGMSHIEDGAVLRRLERGGKGRRVPLGFGLGEVVVMAAPVVWLVVDQTARQLGSAAADSTTVGLRSLVRYRSAESVAIVLRLAARPDSPLDRPAPHTRLRGDHQHHRRGCRGCGCFGRPSSARVPAAAQSRPDLTRGRRTPAGGPLRIVFTEGPGRYVPGGAPWDRETWGTPVVPPSTSTNPAPSELCSKRRRPGGQPGERRAVDRRLVPAGGGSPARAGATGLAGPKE